jgi:large subunit ribosomal protein L21
MYAIVEIAGQQFKVEEGKKIFVHRMDVAVGENVEFEKVLLVDKDGVISVGEPVVADTVVGATVLSHPRGDKVIIFKKKRRKGYQKRSGHRQDFTEIEIFSIGPKGTAPKKAAPKPEKKVTETPVTEETKAETRKAPAKKTAEKKTAEKKTAEKKVAEKKAPAEKKASVKKAPATEKKKPAKK